MTLNLERLVMRLSARRGTEPSQMSAHGRNTPDVLVVCRGPSGLLDLRMALVTACWAVGVRAALVPRECPSLTEQVR